MLATIKTDATVQVRNNLYAIGIFVAALVAVVLAFLAKPSQMGIAIPTLMLLVVGGTTLLYVAGMILFERDEGTINMMIVFSTAHVGISVVEDFDADVFWRRWKQASWLVGSLAIMWFSADSRPSIPNIPILLLGIVAIGIIYTLFGIILVVRYDKITDFLIPMAFCCRYFAVAIFVFSRRYRKLDFFSSFPPVHQPS